ncbi:cache domain-containing protein [Methanoplanus limicola]|nr:cache domain-containing protein [Methanoplanus limicola]
MGNLMNLLVFAVATAAVFGVIVTCGCINSGEGCPGDIADRNTALSELIVFQGGVSNALHHLGRITAGCSAAVTGGGPDENTVTELFDEVMAENSAVYTVIYIDSSGTVRFNNSNASGNISGMNLLSQESVRKQTERRVPMLTDNFVLHDGTSASALYYPVFDSEGIYSGFVSLTFVPCELIKDSAEDIMNTSGLSSMVTEPGGLILYDPDPEEVGKETFDNSLYEDYPEILSFARSLSEDWSGIFEYSFYDTGFDREIRKEAFWTTVTMWDNKWRIFVIREISDS